MGTKEPRNFDLTSESPTPFGSKLTCIAVGSFCLLLSSACSILVGNIKPVSEKSESFTIQELDKIDASWIKLDEQKEIQIKQDAETSDDPANSPLDASDLAYQHKKTSSIISLSTACRPRNALQENTLSQFTDALLLGITDITGRTERTMTLDSLSALETILNGSLSNESVKLAVVVVRKESCVFDLMLVTRAKYFESEKKVFDSFVSSLKF